MNSYTRFVLTLVVVFSCGLSPSFGQAICGNGVPTGPGGNCQGSGGCIPCGGKNSSCNGANEFNSYTGNATRPVIDLQVPGSIGEHPLAWQRYGNTRFVSNSTSFGQASAWRHSYQWEMAVSGTIATINYPNGDSVAFKQSGSSTTWLPPANIADTLTTVSGSYVLQRQDGSQYNLASYYTNYQGTHYRLNDFKDTGGVDYALSYSSNDVNSHLTRVTDPTGRYLQVNWQTLSLNQFADSGDLWYNPGTSDGWYQKTLGANPGYRAVILELPANSFGEIAEIQFYDMSGNLLSGTPICSGPTTPGHDMSKVFDGDTSSYVEFVSPSNNWVGMDFGAGVHQKVSMIRVIARPGYGASLTTALFEGVNAIPSTIQVISSVQSSNGLSTTYNYTQVNDPTLDTNWQALTGVAYNDGTQAVYSVSQLYAGLAPVVTEALDPRKTGHGADIKYIYNPYGANGFLDHEANGVTNETIAQLGAPSTGDGHSSNVFLANGAHKVYRFITNGNNRQTVDGLGRATNFTYQTIGGVASAGFLASEVDALNRTTSYTRSTYGQVLSAASADGTTETFSRDTLDKPLSISLSGSGFAARTITIGRDAVHRANAISYPDGSSESLSYNSLGQVLTHGMRNGGAESFGYDSTGLKTSWVDALGHTWTYAYDANDRLASATDPLGHSISYLYNDRGQVTKTTYSDSSYKAYTYDDYGDVISVRNEIGNVWSYTYDSYQRLLTSTDPLNRTTTYSYAVGGTGGCNCNSTDKPTSMTLPDGKTTTYTYDAEWNVLSQTIGAGTADAATTTYTYDAVNNLLTTTDANGHVWTNTYDNRNRLLTSKDPLNHVTSYTYDGLGNVLTVTRPDGGVTRNVYDLMSRLVQTTDCAGGVTKYTYDNASNLLTITDARNNVYGYTYDLLNRKIKMTYPDGSFEAYGYDAAGNMTTFTTRAGQVRTSVFDSRNREVSYTWSDSTPGVTRSYDVSGRLLTTDNGISASSYAYDTANQLLSETQTNDSLGTSRVVAYSYDAAGNKASVTYPSGEIVSYSRTGREQVDSIAVNGTDFADYAYDGNGNELSKNLPDGTLSSSTYDAANRTVSINHSLSGTSFAYFYYGYDNLDRKTFEQRNSSKGDVFAYDVLGQLASVNYDATNPASGSSGSDRTVGYTYDATGNRSALTDTVNGNESYSVNNLNQYTAAGSASYSYNGNGNLTSGNGTFTYDAQNRLVTATVGSNTDHYYYDSKNRVIQRTVNGVDTYYVYDGWNLIEERDSSGSVLATYVHGVKEDEMLSKTSVSATVFYHYNANGNVVNLTDETGAVVEKYTYDAFGKPTILDPTGNVEVSSGFGNRFLFSGREYQSEVNLYDYRNRMYSPDLGRFLQTDALRFTAQDVNIYRYCGNNPINATDASGLDPNTGTKTYSIGIPTPIPDFSLKFSLTEDNATGDAQMGMGGEVGLTSANEEYPSLSITQNPTASGLSDPNEMEWGFSANSHTGTVDTSGNFGFTSDPSNSVSVGATPIVINSTVPGVPGMQTQAGNQLSQKIQNWIDSWKNNNKQPPDPNQKPTVITTPPIPAPQPGINGIPFKTCPNMSLRL